MNQVLSYTQRRSSDYSNEGERYEIAKMLLLEADLNGTNAVERVVEASWAAGFHGFDEACLRLLAEFVGLFPVEVSTDNKGVISVHLGDAKAALLSADDNVDFWESDELVKVAANLAPDQWIIHETKMEQMRQQFFDLNGSWANPD